MTSRDSAGQINVQFFALWPLSAIYLFTVFVLLNNRKPRAKQHKGQKGKDDVYLGEIKYTAQRLYEKGVILEIEGLPPSQSVKLKTYFIILK